MLNFKKNKMFIVFTVLFSLASINIMSMDTGTNIKEVKQTNIIKNVAYSSITLLAACLVISAQMFMNITPTE